MNYYSQFGQDRHLNEKYFNNQDSGLFVDIGAHDGVTASNSLFFEQKGWSGICFEPITEVFNKLKANRSCTLKNLALSYKSGEAKYPVIKGYSEMLSGLQDSYNPMHLDRIRRELEQHQQTMEVIDIKCSTFEEEVPFNTIDYLSIDVEGSEYDILKTIDFNKYYIKTMSVELNYSEQHIIDLLLLNGFEIDCQLGVDVIFKNKRFNP